MRDMLLIYSDENTWTESDLEHCYAESIQLAQQLQAQGQYLSAAPLHPVSTATSVRVRDGKRLVTDGPFAETREQLGGYFLIDVRDVDEAIDVAGRIPGARVGSVEIRPIMELSGLHQTSSCHLLTPDSTRRAAVPSSRLRSGVRRAPACHPAAHAGREAIVVVHLGLH